MRRDMKDKNLKNLIKDFNEINEKFAGFDINIIFNEIVQSCRKLKSARAQIACLKSALNRRKQMRLNITESQIERNPILKDAARNSNNLIKKIEVEIQNIENNIELQGLKYDSYDPGFGPYKDFNSIYVIDNCKLRCGSISDQINCLKREQIRFEEKIIDLRYYLKDNEKLRENVLKNWLKATENE